MKIRNKQLYNEYKNICISALNLLKKYSDKKIEFPFTIEDKIVFHRDGKSFSFYHIKKPDLHSFVNKHYKKILNLSEFKAFSDFIHNDKRLRLLRKIDENQVQHGPFSALFNFLSKLLERTASFEFSIQNFNKTYQEYEDYLNLDILHFNSFCLMINFQSDIENIKLRDGLIIKKISNNERRKIWRMRTTKEHDLLGIKWISQFQFNVKRKERFNYNLPSENFNDLITALRLFKTGDVGYKHIYSSHQAKWDETTRASLVERKISGKKYVLLKSEVYEFKKWWKEFKKLKALMTRKEIEIAIKRFNYAYERISLEDKLIDYIIAFESLLLTGEPEKRFRFALSGAFLLGKEIKELNERYAYMKEVREYLSEAYKLRNNIVHGSKELKKKIVIDKKEMSIQEFMEGIENYLRKSIKIYLERRKKLGKKEILDELENAIFATK